MFEPRPRASIALTNQTTPKHVPAHFSKLTKQLEAAGYSCTGVSLPSNSPLPPIYNRLPGIFDDQSAIRDTILSQLETG